MAEVGGGHEQKTAEGEGLGSEEESEEERGEVRGGDVLRERRSKFHAVTSPAKAGDVNNE